MLFARNRGGPVVIKVVGADCAHCAALETVARQAVASLGLSATVEQVRDFAMILSYGAMSTPMLLVDDRVVVAGRVPSLEELSRILAGAAPN
jgi:small redox-active disulfide protein 2